MEMLKYDIVYISRFNIYESKKKKKMGARNLVSRAILRTKRLLGRAAAG